MADLNVLPEKWKPYTKAVIAFVPVAGFVLVALVQALVAEGVSVPTWLAVLATFFTAVGVYEFPNEPVSGSHDV